MKQRNKTERKKDEFNKKEKIRINERKKCSCVLLIKGRFAPNKVYNFI